MSPSPVRSGLFVRGLLVRIGVALHVPIHERLYRLAALLRRRRGADTLTEPIQFSSVVGLSDIRSVESRSVVDSCARVGLEGHYHGVRIGRGPVGGERLEYPPDLARRRAAFPWIVSGTRPK